VEKIILDHMDKLENKKYELIAKSLSVPLENVLAAVSMITTSNPSRADSTPTEETIYISPDIYVFKMGDDYEIVLNEDGLPKLKINAYYRDILTARKPWRTAPSSTFRTSSSPQPGSSRVSISDRGPFTGHQQYCPLSEGVPGQGHCLPQALVLRDVAEDI